jgi:hypothetical protein
MSSQNSLLVEILRSSRTVFTPQSLLLIDSKISASALAVKMHRYTNQGVQLNPRRGIYAKQGYNIEEMACSLFRPSYISLEYVLQRAGVVFQYDSTVTSVSYLSRTIDVDGHSYSFRKINYELWAGMEGIVTKDNINIATPERAFLDMLYHNTTQNLLILNSVPARYANNPNDCPTAKPSWCWSILPLGSSVVLALMP